ncbi:hypothetical protein PG991_015590 [Apiospora marii]|uniref:Uncharacterized protein n=1 Tax=Apiospora marii TaxID=335849 RepID=A0ABR1R303_9PEZI
MEAVVSTVGTVVGTSPDGITVPETEELPRREETIQESASGQNTSTQSDDPDRVLHGILGYQRPRAHVIGNTIEKGAEIDVRFDDLHGTTSWGHLASRVAQSCPFYGVEVRYLRAVNYFEEPWIPVTKIGALEVDEMKRDFRGIAAPDGTRALIARAGQACFQRPGGEMRDVFVDYHSLLRL